MTFREAVQAEFTRLARRIILQEEHALLHDGRGVCDCIPRQLQFDFTYDASEDDEDY